MFLGRELATGGEPPGHLLPMIGRGPRREALSSVAVSKAGEKEGLFSLGEVARIEMWAPQISVINE